MLFLIHGLVYGFLGVGVEILFTSFFAKLYYAILNAVIRVVGVQKWLGEPREIDPEFRGQTSFWMFPIYGLGIAVGIEWLHELIRHFPWPIRGLIWMFSIWLIEFLAGFIFLRATGKRLWDYSNRRFDVLGHIYLFYGPFWFGFGFLLEYIHNLLLELDPHILEAASKAWDRL
ncbi:MAG: hypothetical protein AAB562_03480 [Patescibacteria group bacterium]